VEKKSRDFLGKKRMTIPPRVLEQLVLLRANPHRAVKTEKVEAFVHALCQSPRFLPSLGGMQLQVEGHGVAIRFDDWPGCAILVLEPQVRFFSPAWTFSRTLGDWGFRERDMGDADNIRQYGAVWFNEVVEARR
jgi:hypothetical protein